MSPLELLAATAVVLVGATLQGAVGFGFALVCAPILVLLDPLLVPGPLVGASFVLVLLTAHREREVIEFGELKWGFLGRLVGTPVGAAVVASIPAEDMGLPLGVVVLLAVAMNGSGFHVAPSPRTLLGAGTLSGFMGTASSIGGPPLALVYQHEAGGRLRGTLAAHFVLGSLLSLVALSAVGRFGTSEVGSALLLVPGVLVGFTLSGRMARWIDRGYTRASVLTVSALAALIAILRQLL